VDGVFYGELTVVAIWLALLAASSRGRRDAVGTLLLAVAPVVLAFFEVVNETVSHATEYSDQFSRLRLPLFHVPLAILLGGAVYVYGLRALSRGAVRGTADLRAVNWLPSEFRYLAFLAVFSTSAWPIEWMGIRLQLWHWVGGQTWNADFLRGVYQFYVLFVLGSILYAWLLAWLVGAPGGERR